MNTRPTGSLAPVHSRVAACSAPLSFTLSRPVRALLAALPALAASAAFAQAADPSPSQEVVVTAARVAQKLPDTLPSTTVISRADIEASPAADLPDLLRTFTSFNIAQTGPFGAQTSVFVRGANSNQVLVLIDGAPLSRADFGSAPWELVPLGQIDHVEIVRGNLSSLYGAQAVGGVVQIFTKHGAGASVAFSGGSRGTLDLSASIGRRFGIADAPLDISGSVSGKAIDGYSARDAKADASANPDRDPSYQSGETFAIGKTWTPGQRTTFSVLHSDTHSDYDGYSGSTAQDTLKTSLDAYNLQSHHALGSAVSLDLSAGETVDHYKDPTGFTQSGTARTRLLGAGVDWTIVDGQSVQFGYENNTEHYGDTSNGDALRRTNSIRAGYLGSFASAFDVQANIRHDDASDYGIANTGLLALGWRITPAWKLVAQASTAFSAPSFSDIQYQAGPLAPERSRDIELGVHWHQADWLARVTVFSQRQRNLIAFTPDFQTVNIDRASNRGIELMADGDTGYGKLGVDVTFQDARDDTHDTALLRRARTLATANYRLPIFGWETGVWVRYNGVRADADPATFSTVQAKARTTLGLSTQHALSPNWSIGLKADNITNTKKPEVLGYTAPPPSVMFTLRGQWQ
ncbi:MAG: TonB-dependent receptor [Betaproteobacteria bacterium]